VSGSGEDPVSANQSTYDAIAADFAGRSHAPWPELVPLVDAFAARLSIGDHVLDAGCGTGRDVRLLRERGLRAFGIDRSRAMLAEGAVARLVQADMRWLPIRTGALAGVWSYAALLHVSRSEAPSLFAEWRRVLRPGGVMSLCTAVGDFEGWEQVSYRPDRRRWFVYHDPEDLQQMIVDAGFAVISTTTGSTHREWLTVVARR
jgi:SAM-dependent methyltransferase